ncbi:MAG: acyltransferase family protein [Prevotella sp.]|nr:acyltransferase family protein [Prevotella sp.]
MPSVVFGILYFLIFFEYKGMGSAIYSILNGCGHMWYLPMLFWCFVFGWLLEQVKISDSWKLMILIAFNLFTMIGLPLRISNALTFMVYFYGGYLFYKNADTINIKITTKRIILAWVVFALCFICFRPLRDVLETSPEQSLWLKIGIRVGNSMCKLIYVWAGIVSFYVTAVYYTKRHQITGAIKDLSACCFGIYLIQQFVLQLLYYKTDFPSLVGPYWLPWCGFAIAIISSYIVTKLLLKTKTGKFLIG